MSRSRELAELATAYDSGGSFAFRNRIINGQMMIDQRNAGASITPTTAANSWGVDRFLLAMSQSSKFSAQQNAGAVTPPAGFTNYLGVTSLSSYTCLAADYFNIQQRIEGFNFSDLGFGTAAASTVTVSFWVRSSLTGSFGGSLGNSNATRQYPFSYTISAANTWEQKTVTMAGDTTGTWNKTNGIGAILYFGIGYGSTYGSGTAGAWVGADLEVPTGSVSIVGTNGATFYITGVQLEKGSTATSFDYRPYGTELMLCQRYYAVTRGYARWFASGASQAMNTPAYWPVVMRASPTAAIGTNSGQSNVVSSQISSLSAYGGRFEIVSTAAGDSYIIDAVLTATAEL